VSDLRAEQVPDDAMAKLTEAAIGVLEAGDAAPEEVQSMPPTVLR